MNAETKKTTETTTDLPLTPFGNLLRHSRPLSDWTTISSEPNGIEGDIVTWLILGHNDTECEVLLAEVELVISPDDLIREDGESDIVDGAWREYWEESLEVFYAEFSK